MKPTWCVTALWTAVLVLGSTLASAQSGSLEPPGSAVNGSGDPVATTQTQPSWDQVLPASERFKLVMGGAAVLDKETGLVWEQSPQATSRLWSDARADCEMRTVGGRRGWRLPSLHELTSLIDPNNTNPPLPTSHPFSIELTDYWSATTVYDSPDPNIAWIVFFGSGFSYFFEESGLGANVWCVRGGQNHREAY